MCLAVILWVSSRYPSDMHIDQPKSKLKKINLKIKTPVISLSTSVVTFKQSVWSCYSSLIKAFFFVLPLLIKHLYFCISTVMNLSARCHCFSWAPGWIFITILTQVVLTAQGKAPLHLTPGNDNIPGKYMVVLKVRRSQTAFRHTKKKIMSLTSESWIGFSCYQVTSSWLNLLFIFLFVCVCHSVCTLKCPEGPRFVLCSKYNIFLYDVVTLS